MPATKKASRTPAAPKSSSAARKSTRTPGGPHGAIALLTQDHKDVKKLFKAFDKLAEDGADATERQQLAEQICGMLTVHATVEEEIFYPAARGAIDETDLLDEAEVEHASAKDLIAQIQNMQPDDDLYDAKVKVLGEYIDHHVQEEEGEMFPKVAKTDLDLAALGEELAARKEALMGEMGLTEAA